MRTRRQRMSGQKITANEFTNVKDIKGQFLYSKDKKIFTYLQLQPINLSLASADELAAKTKAFTRSFEGKQGSWMYFTLPREVDLDIHKNHIKKVYEEEYNNVGRRMLLESMLRYVTDLSGNNYDHQHFIKLWRETGTDQEEAEARLKEYAYDMRAIYYNAGIMADILKDTDIIKLCNLYGNNSQAAFEGTPKWYEAVPMI